VETADDIDLSRYPPTPHDLAAGFRIATRDLAPAIQRAEVEHGPTALISAFVMLGDILDGVRRYRRATGRACPPERAHAAGADALAY
jgi:hypothetical protein